MERLQEEMSPSHPELRASAPAGHLSQPDLPSGPSDITLAQRDANLVLSHASPSEIMHVICLPPSLTHSRSAASNKQGMWWWQGRVPMQGGVSLATGIPVQAQLQPTSRPCAHMPSRQHCPRWGGTQISWGLLLSLLLTRASHHEHVFQISQNSDTSPNPVLAQALSVTSNANAHFPAAWATRRVPESRSPLSLCFS